MFSKSERSNTVGTAIAVTTFGFLACLSALYFFRGDPLAWIAVPLFVVLTIVGVRGFTRPYVTTFEVSEGALSITRSDRGVIATMPWTTIAQIEVFEVDGLDVYARQLSGRRIKLSDWVRLSGEEIDRVLRIAGHAAPQVRIDDGRKKTA